MRSVIRLGTVAIRISRKGLAPWGFPRIQIGALSLWSWSNSGNLNLAAWHPRSSITWHWYVAIGGRGGVDWSAGELARRRMLWWSGNPHAPLPRWWHRFVRRDALRRSQWHDYYRLPFGLTLIVGRQDYHLGRAV